MSARRKPIADRAAELTQMTTGQLVTRMLELNPMGGYTHAQPASNQIKRETILRYEYGSQAFREFQGGGR